MRDLEQVAHYDKFRAFNVHSGEYNILSNKRKKKLKISQFLYCE